MAANYIRYEETVQYEVFGPTCIKATNLFEDIRNDIKAESKELAGFITVKEYAKNLKSK